MEPEKNLRESIKKSSLKKLLFSPEQSDTRLKLIVVIGLAAIAVIFLSDYVGGQTQSASAQVNAAAPLHYSGTGYEEYTAQLEARLTELISFVEGAGQAKVMITLECGTEYVYASRQKSTSAVSEDTNPDGRVSRDEKRSGEESLVLVNVGRGEEPLILKQLTPTVAGVVVLCSGADDVNVRQQIINVVTTALGTSSNRVCVSRLA